MRTHKQKCGKIRFSPVESEGRFQGPKKVFVCGGIAVPSTRVMMGWIFLLLHSTHQNL